MAGAVLQSCNCASPQAEANPPGSLDAGPRGRQGKDKRGPLGETGVLMAVNTGAAIHIANRPGEPTF